MGHAAALGTGAEVGQPGGATCGGSGPASQLVAGLAGVAVCPAGA